jgi:hypothetical protein
MGRLIYQLVLHRFRDKFAKRDSTFGGNGFGTTKDGIGNFQSGFHEVNHASTISAISEQLRMPEKEAGR